MRLGLVAAARIAPKAVIVPAREVDGIDVVAVGARSLDRAKAFAEEWGIPRAEGSYEAVIEAEDVDAVYIATPAAEHRRWTISALDAGKAVLCEKPIGANAADAVAMVAAAERTGRVLVEAFHWRYHPMADRIAAILASGRIGEVRHVRGEFSIPAGDIPRTDIRWDLALGGGALMDLGCYALQWCRFAAGAEPEVVSASAECPVPGIDATMTAQLVFPDGVTGEVHCSMDAPPGQRVASLHVVGSEGELMVLNPLAPQMGNLLTVTTSAGEEHESVAQTSTYVHQLRAFVAAVDDGVAAPTGGADAIATMRAIDAIYDAAGLSPRPSA